MREKKKDGFDCVDIYIYNSQLSSSVFDETETIMEIMRISR